MIQYRSASADKPVAKCKTKLQATVAGHAWQLTISGRQKMKLLTRRISKAKFSERHCKHTTTGNYISNIVEN